MELKASNDGKYKFSNEFSGLFKVSNFKVLLTYFYSFFFYRTLKALKTLLLLPVVPFPPPME